jgi:hypothetical protein
MGKEYCELAPERLIDKLDDDFWQTAKEIADEPEAKLIASLLNVEAKHQAINQRQGIYQALNQQIKQQKMSQESEIYLGYKSKQAKNVDKAASTICEAVSPTMRDKSFRIAFLKLTNRPVPKDKIIMFVTQAGASIALELVKLCQITDKAEVFDRIAILLQEIIKHQQDYYQLFHSIRWNRSRKKVKVDTEEKLVAIRLQALAPEWVYPSRSPNALTRK